MIRLAQQESCSLTHDLAPDGISIHKHEGSWNTTHGLPDCWLAGCLAWLMSERVQACYPDEDPLSLAQGMTSSAVTALQQAGIRDVEQLQWKLRKDRGQCLAALGRALDQPSAEACLRVGCRRSSWGITPAMYL